MANIFPAVWTDIRTALRAVWPEAAANYRAIQVRRLNWSNLIESGKIVPPYVVVHIPPYVSNTEFAPIGTLVFDLDIRLFYIAANSTSTDIGATLEAKMKAMIDYLRASTTAFTAIQVMEDGFEIDVSETNEITQSMQEANMPYTGASIGFKAIAGEMPPA